LESKMLLTFFDLAYAINLTKTVWQP
jgi:hypothetical protein